MAHLSSATAPVRAECSALDRAARLGREALWLMLLRAAAPRPLAFTVGPLMSIGTHRSTQQRLLLLCVCLFAGCAIGLVGRHFTGSSAWFLAVPVLVLVAWFVVADPTECLPSNERRSDGGSGH